MKLSRRQKGQAIPIGIASILGVTILMLALFNTSQITSEKMRIVNTADAAVFSGMVVQARTMNFTSYTNRAMVANQVALGQMVTLASFGPYVERLGTNIAKALKFIPWAGLVLSAGLQTAVQVANALISGYAQVAAIGIHVMQAAISAAQIAANNASAVATPLLVSEVIKANDPNYEVTAAGVILAGKNTKDWAGVSDLYKNNLYQSRKADLVRRSVDRFTSRDRGWGKANIGDLWFVFAYFQRDADTRLISKGNKNSRKKSDIKWEWKAKDTFSLWAGTRWWSCGWSGCGWKKAEGEIPIGWASAFMSQTNKDFDNASSSSCFLWFCWGKSPWNFKNQTAESLADMKKYKKNISAGYMGIMPYYDLADSGKGASVKQKKNAITALGIEIRRKTSSPIRTSSNIKNLGSKDAYVSGSTKNGLGNKGLFRVDDNFAGKNMGVSAVARAELYFSRPVGVGKWSGYSNFGANRRTDIPKPKEEYSNLFNPYWDVRLADPKNERKAALVARGLSKFF